MSDSVRKTSGTIASVRLRRLLARRGLLLAVPLFVVASCLMVAGFIRRAEDMHSSAWPSTPGTLIDAHYPADDAGDAGPADDPDRARIRYRYRVNDRTYEGDRVSLHSTWPPHDFREAHPKGSEVTVYYDPQDPAVAVLQPGADHESHIGFLCPFVFSVFCFVFLFEAVQARRLLRLVRGGRLDAVLALIRGKMQPGVSSEAVLVAADRPEPEIFSFLVPFVGKRRLEMLTAYAGHQGTPWMRERLQSALVDRADDRAARETEESPEAARATIPRIPAWLDPMIHRLEAVYEEMSTLAQLTLMGAVLFLVAGGGFLSTPLQRVGFLIFIPIGLLWIMLSTIAWSRVGTREKKAREAGGPQPGDEPAAPSTPAQAKPAGRFGRLMVNTIGGWAGPLIGLGILGSFYCFLDPPEGFGIKAFALLWLGVLVIILLGLPVCVVIAAIRYWAGGRGGDDRT